MTLGTQLYRKGLSLPSNSRDKILCIEQNLIAILLKLTEKVAPVLHNFFYQVPPNISVGEYQENIQKAASEHDLKNKIEKLFQNLDTSTLTCYNQHF